MERAEPSPSLLDTNNGVDAEIDNQATMDDDATSEEVPTNIEDVPTNIKDNETVVPNFSTFNKYSISPSFHKMEHKQKGLKEEENLLLKPSM